MLTASVQSGSFDEPDAWSCAVDRDRPVIVHAAEAAPAPGPVTPGMDRRQLLDDEDRWVGWVLTAAGMAGGWHHHGERDSYIFVLRGTVTVEYGPGGRERVIARPGDFVFNPGGMVHREITGPEEPAELFVVRVGTGPQTVNTDGPEPDARGPEDANG
jgi:mannose-6-phosphate isomerase-like protein (cupin superfamily)